MEYLEFRELVRIARDNNPIWFGLEADIAASDAEITQAQSELGVSFPQEYIDFLKDFGGGYFAFVNVFSVQQESAWNVVQRNKRQPIDGFLAISDNGVGDLFGFRVSLGICQPSIVIFDHEEGSVKPTCYRDLLEFLAEKGLRHKSTP